MRTPYERGCTLKASAAIGPRDHDVMPLNVGTRLSHYDVTSLLSESEKRQVWQATAPLRTHPIRLRVTALLVLGVFAAVNIATTVYSLGAYCLTTYGGNPFAGSGP